jgi:hypothetical protein
VKKIMPDMETALSSPISGEISISEKTIEIMEERLYREI